MLMWMRVIALKMCAKCFISLSVLEKIFSRFTFNAGQFRQAKFSI